jgi:succinate-semialdehyde dehydrogenase / glutarate-semialdehyde dehydrogenase
MPTTSTTSTVMEIINPANFNPVGTVQVSSAKDVEQVLKNAQDGKKVWAATPMWKRREILNRYLDLLTVQKLEVAHTLCLETGKPLEQAIDEVSGGIRMFREYVNRVLGLHGTTIPLDSQEGLERDVLMSHRQPLGVLAAILPFNFPIDTFSHKTGAALVTGNAVIVKPAEDAPLAVMHAVRLMHQAGVPENVIQVVIGRGDVGAMITDTPLVNAISFTGSTAIGSRVMAAGAKYISRVYLELGGNDPFIVFEDADMDTVMEHAAFARTYCNGQCCVASKRFIVHSSKLEEFTARLLESLKSYTVGNPLEASTKVGPLIHEAAAKRAEEQIAHTVAQGARVLSGGERFNRTFLAPTVLEGVTFEMDVARDMEIFAPVFPIISFKEDQQALEIANASVYGLNAGVFTQSINRAIQAGYALESGTVCVNGAGLYHPDAAAFGGFKQSGLGREGTLSGLEEMTQIKSIVFRNALA